MQIIMYLHLGSNKNKFIQVKIIGGESLTSSMLCRIKLPVHSQNQRKTYKEVTEMFGSKRSIYRPKNIVYCSVDKKQQNPFLVEL